MSSSNGRIRSRLSDHMFTLTSRPLCMKPGPYHTLKCLEAIRVYTCPLASTHALAILHICPSTHYSLTLLILCHTEGDKLVNMSSDSQISQLLTQIPKVREPNPLPIEYTVCSSQDAAGSTQAPDQVSYLPYLIRRVRYCPSLSLSRPPMSMNLLVADQQMEIDLYMEQSKNTKGCAGQWRDSSARIADVIFRRYRNAHHQGLERWTHYYPSKISNWTIALAHQ